ncbi:hypothetical protein [Pseudomonas rubra]|nr:hypothetical protein [Pseudomonas rubra]
MQEDALNIGGLAIHPTHTKSSSIREYLKGLSIFDGYAFEIDAALNIMEHCRHWLPEEIGAQLSNAALQHNDAIYQVVSYYGAEHLAARFRSDTGVETATDVQAIAAFALANAIRALCGLADHLQGADGQEIPALEYYQMHLECIDECVPGASAWLDPDENEACCKIGDLASAASKQVDNKIDGILSGITRRKELANRDLAITKKALDLYFAGTPFRNLNSKLRAWQHRETGKSLSKVQMGEILKRAGLSL